eukprot:767193-Hanusia_phi.AAC.2
MHSHPLHVSYREALLIDPGCTIAAEGLAAALTDEGTRIKLLGQGEAAYLKYKEASQICPRTFSDLSKFASCLLKEAWLTRRCKFED